MIISANWSLPKARFSISGQLFRFQLPYRLHTEPKQEAGRVVREERETLVAKKPWLLYESRGENKGRRRALISFFLPSSVTSPLSFSFLLCFDSWLLALKIVDPYGIVFCLLLLTCYPSSLSHQNNCTAWGSKGEIRKDIERKLHVNKCVISASISLQGNGAIKMHNWSKCCYYARSCLSMCRTSRDVQNDSLHWACFKR